MQDDSPKPWTSAAEPNPPSEMPLVTSEEDWHEITLDLDEPEVQAIGEITEVAPDLAAFVAELEAVTSLGALSSDPERTWNPNAEPSTPNVSITPERNDADVIDVTPSATWREQDAAITVEPAAANTPLMFGRLEVEPLHASPSVVPREPLGSADAFRQSILRASEQDRAEVVDVAPSVVLP